MTREAESQAGERAALAPGRAGERAAPAPGRASEVARAILHQVSEQDGARIRITRRGIQVALGLLWLLDGLLQFQPGMLTRKFATEVIAPAASGQPGFVSGPVDELARLILHQPAAFDVAFGLIQVALGAGLLYRRTARLALFGSVAWALAVWYLGEGLGDLFGGGRSLLTGAPGSALLYAVVAMLVLPGRDGAAAHAGADRPSRWAAPAWAAVWILGAVLQLLPGSDTNDLLGAALQMNAQGAPAWFASLDNHLALLIPYTGVSLILDLVVLQALTGAGVFAGRRVRQIAVIVGICLSVAFWIAGQDLGEFWSALSTDPNTAPLLVLLGVTVLGADPWSSSRPASAGSAPAGSASAGSASAIDLRSAPGFTGKGPRQNKIQDYGHLT
jgi:hypothetical protein